MPNLIQVLAILLMTVAGLVLPHSSIQQATKEDKCTAWVDSVYSSMTMAERIGQMVMVNVNPAVEASAKANIREMVVNNHIGGLFLSKGKAEQFAELNNYAQSLAKVPLLTGIDGEWGPGMRVLDAKNYPYNMGLGAISDPALLYRYGRQSALEFKALGIYANFGPVLDVNNNPANPVIGNRSFGEDPCYVGKLGKNYALGLESEGVMSVAKHFPGHGDTNTDSHKALPTIHHDEEMLDTVDLLPFKTYIDAGLSGIMVGHLNVPALDPSGRPSSMSKPIITDVLKDDMGFNGLIFTDGLGMKGAAVKENICVAAILAGNDILLGPTSVKSDIQALLKAVETGRIPAERIEYSCKKILRYKYALGLYNKPVADASKALQIMDSPQAKALRQDLANAEITVLSNKGNILPIGNLANNSIALVNIGAPANNEFTSICRRYADVDVYTSNTALPIAKIRKHDVVIAAVYNDKHESVNALQSLKDVNNLIVVTFIDAYKMTKLRNSLTHAKSVMLAYDNNEYSERAAAMALFGGINVSGHLPVNVSGVGSMGQGVEIAKSRLGYSSPYAKGMDSNLTANIDREMKAAMSTGAFPGAQVLVVKNGDVVVDRSYGLTTKDGNKVDFSTIYDLASVSKTVGTLPGVMKAYDLGLFNLDTPASQYIPGLNVDDKRDITPRMFLFHETGMPASLNMFNVMMDTTTYTGRVLSSTRDADHTIPITGGGFGHNTAKMRTDIVSNTKTPEFNIEAAKGIYTGKCTYDTIMANIYRATVKPSRSYVYSCLNFCLLMDLEQRVTGIDHYTWVADSIWAPLGAYNMCYRPKEKFPLERIAATEEDTYLRKQHVHGYVHDELANFSGGVQGNAGVFGNANDIAKICQMWLNGGKYGDVRVLSDETVNLFTTAKSPTCRRGLGFDKPDVNNKDNSPTVDEAGPSVYGHTGFTGTCFWVDPENDLIFIFLCNRVDPSRDNKTFSNSRIRSKIMRIVYNSL